MDNLFLPFVECSTTLHPRAKYLINSETLRRVDFSLTAVKALSSRQSFLPSPVIDLILHRPWQITKLYFIAIRTKWIEE